MIGKYRTSALVACATLAAAGALPAVAAASGEAIAPAAGSTARSAPGEATGAASATTTTAAESPTRKPGKESKPAAGRKRAHLSVHVHGIQRDHALRVANRARAFGYLRPFVAGEHVRVKLKRNGHVVRELNPKVRKVPHKDKGRFKFKSKGLVKPGSYRVTAVHSKSGKQKEGFATSRKFGIRYPDLDPGNRNSAVRVFNRLLRKQGYFTSNGKKYGVRTRWAVMAFRKVNGMKRTFNANPTIFRALADRRGEFRLKHPGKGKHVEVDISRQVMVLANRGKAQHTFAVSTGAAATPTVRGHYRFYRRQPGYNSVRMYYSVYFIRGYAIHGYHSVPTYPASHGCVRNPIPDSKFIYDWVKLGMSIYVYG